MASKELIEKVARHIRVHITGDEYSMSCGLSIEDARAASMELLADILAALQEPTEGMILSYEEYMNETKTFSRPHGAHVWRAMLNASPLGEQSE